MPYLHAISRCLVLASTLPLFLPTAKAASYAPSRTYSYRRALSASLLNVSFGNVQIGQSQTQYETLTNSGSSAVTISQATLTGAGFALNGLGLPLSLNKGQSVTFSVAFTPMAGGSVSGGITIVSNDLRSYLKIALAGTGVSAGSLSSSASALNFGSVTVGTSKSATVTLTAAGSSVTVLSATSSSAEFSLTGLSLPQTLAPGQNVAASLVFTPQSSGAASGNISFASTAADTPVIESLTGSGTTPLSHTVSLGWNASTSAVVGYNVYRGSTSGGPYARINPVLGAGTNYLDNSVQGGKTYYYVSTAVGTSGVESGYSTQIRAIIPSP
jgi:hypothetical protein